MEDTVLQRVTDILNVRYDGNVSRMSKALGVNTTTLAYQLNGKRSISLDTITAIAKANPDISVRWLISGVGKMVDVPSTVINQQSGEHSTNTSLQYNDSTTVQTLCDSLREQIKTKDEQIRTLLEIVSRCHGNV